MTVSLTGRQKAAMIVRLLQGADDGLAVSRLPDDIQMTLAREVAALRLVDRTTLEGVVAEFAALLDQVALTGPGGVAAALKEMEGQLSPAARTGLEEEIARSDSAYPWRRIEAEAPEILLDMLAAEAAEVGAILLSRLPAARAAALLKDMPGPRARRIAHAMSRTRGIAPDLVDRVGAALVAQHLTPPPLAFADPAADRVAEILNASPSKVRDDVLAGLVETDPDFAAAVRAAIFTFADIPDRVAAEDVPAILRLVENDRVLTALAAASADPATEGVVGFLLSGLTNRMADQIRDGIEERGSVRPDEGEAAMAEVAAAVREAAARGEIALRDPNEAADEAAEADAA